MKIWVKGFNFFNSARVRKRAKPRVFGPPPQIGYIISQGKEAPYP